MISGKCTGDDNPDAWFPESPQGRQTPAKMQALGNEIYRAISLCNSCNQQDECLSEGMETKNLPYGIWGGRLAGERILMADEQGIDYMVKGRTGGIRSAVGVADAIDMGPRYVPRGIAKGFVVIKENEGVTIEEKRNATKFLERIRPWIKEWA